MIPIGIDVRVSSPDARPTVVLVHGAPDRGATFGPVLDHLGDLRVVTYDRRGYGRSVAAEPPSSMVDHARDLLAIVAEQPGPCVVVAHSFGSNPAMLAATLEPTAFPALGVWEPPLPWVDWWPQSTKDANAEAAASGDPEALGEQIWRHLLGQDAWDRLSEEARRSRRAEGRAFRSDMTSLLTEPYRFSDVRLPTVVAYGTESFEDRRIGAPWLVDRLPDARLVAVEGAGHFGHRTHAAAFAEFVHAVVALA